MVSKPFIHIKHLVVVTPTVLVTTHVGQTYKKLKDSEKGTLTMSNSSKYDLRGAKIGILTDTNSGKLIYVERQHNISQPQNLAAAAAEIQELLHYLSQTYSPVTDAEKQLVVTEAIRTIEQNPELNMRVIGALRSGGTEALKDLVDHPLINVLRAALEGWQKP